MRPGNAAHVWIAVAWLLAGCTDDPINIPFRYERNIYLRTILDGRTEAGIMFDTGAYNLYLDSFFQKKSGIAPFIYSDALGNITTRHLHMAVSTVSFSPEETYLINTRPTFGRQCDGIVGWNIFGDHVIAINYADSLITLHDPRFFEEDPSYSMIPITVRNNLYYVHLDVAVSPGLIISGEFVFDTGYGGSVYLTGQTARRYRLDTLNTPKAVFEMHWATVERRKSLGMITRGHNIKLHNFHINQPPLEISWDSTGILGKGEYAGLLGNRVLEHFDVVFNPSGKALYLRPNGDYRKKMRFVTLGLGFVDRTDIYEGWPVITLEADAEAKARGIRCGDLITHVNGKAVKEASDSLATSIYRPPYKSTPFTFLRKDSAFTISLKVTEPF